MKPLHEHAESLEAINRDLSHRYKTTPDGTLAHCIYSIRRTIDHLKEIQ